jgi:hypothetical protein
MDSQEVGELIAHFFCAGFKAGVGERIYFFMSQCKLAFESRFMFNNREILVNTKAQQLFFKTLMPRHLRGCVRPCVCGYVKIWVKRIVRLPVC